MVYRLAANEVKQAVLDVGTRMQPDLRYWAPIDLNFLGQSWETLCAYPSYRAYGLQMENATVGLLLGMMVPDMNSGLLQGLEYFWGVEKKFRSRALGLLRMFEKDCKDAGCKIIMLGSIRSMEPENRKWLYGRLGYEPHAEVFSKRLS
jgi:hypothetical protein